MKKFIHREKIEMNLNRRWNRRAAWEPGTPPTRPPSAPAAAAGINIPSPSNRTKKKELAEWKFLISSLSFLFFYIGAIGNFLLHEKDGALEALWLTLTLSLTHTQVLSLSLLDYHFTCLYNIIFL